MFKTMVAQAVCDLEADAAPAEPEKVQEVARLTTAASGAGVMAGAAGAASADAASDAVNATTDKNCILIGIESLLIVRRGLAAWPKCLVSSDRYIGLSEGAILFAYAALDASSQSIWDQILQCANEAGLQLPPISEHCVVRGAS